MSNKNKKISLSDRLNNPDRMSRAVGIHLSSLQSEELIEVNDNSIIKNDIKLLTNDNTLIEIKDNINNNTKDFNTPLEKPLGEHLIKPLNNNIDININKDKILDIEVSKTKEIVINNDIEKSLAELISQKVQLIEKLQREELAPASLSKKKTKIKFDDRNPIISFPARPELEEIIDLIFTRTGEKKYKIFEILLLNGLKNTEF